MNAVELKTSFFHALHSPTFGPIVVAGPAQEVSSAGRKVLSPRVCLRVVLVAQVSLDQSGVQGDDQRGHLLGEFLRLVSSGVRFGVGHWGGNLRDEVSLPASIVAQGLKLTLLKAEGLERHSCRNRGDVVSVKESRRIRRDEANLDQACHLCFSGASLGGNFRVSQTGDGRCTELIGAQKCFCLARRHDSHNLTRIHGFKLLTNNLQRRVVVSLSSQDVAKAIDVFLSEAAVTGRSTLWRDQTFGFEEANLRHGNVRELLVQLLQNDADRHGLGLLRLHCPFTQGCGVGLCCAHDISLGASLRVERDSLLLVGDENQTEFADLNFVAHVQHLGVARLAVDVGAVEGSDVDDLELALIHAEFGMAARNGDIIKEDVSLWVTARSGGGLVKKETGASIWSTLYNEKCLPLREVLSTSNGGLVTRRGAVFHLLEKVCTEYRSGFYLRFRGSGLLAHFYLRMVGFMLTYSILATHPRARASSPYLFRKLC